MRTSLESTAGWPVAGDGRPYEQTVTRIRNAQSTLQKPRGGPPLRLESVGRSIDGSSQFAALRAEADLVAGGDRLRRSRQNLGRIRELGRVHLVPVPRPAGNPVRV